MSKPGRSAKGRWLSDDDATVQAMDQLHAALAMMLTVLQSRENILKVEQELLASADRHLERYQEIVAQIDVGTKPKGTGR